MGKTYTISYVSMDQEHLGSNPLYHAGVVLSVYDDKTKTMQAINAWGLYSTVIANDELSTIRRMLGVNFRITGAYGTINQESMAFLERGVGLKGHTAEITEEMAHELQTSFKRQLMLQYDALEEAKAALVSEGVDKRALDVLIRHRETSAQQFIEQSSDREQLKSDLLALDFPSETVDLLFSLQDKKFKLAPKTTWAILVDAGLSEQKAEAIIDSESNLARQALAEEALLELYTQQATRVLHEAGADDKRVLELLGSDASVAQRMDVADAEIQSLYAKVPNPSPESILQNENAWLAQQRQLNIQVLKTMVSDLRAVGVSDSVLNQLSDPKLVDSEKEKIIQQCVDRIPSLGIPDVDLSAKGLSQIKEQLTYLVRVAKANNAAEQDRDRRLQPFNFNLFSSDANYCKVYALNTMRDAGVSNTVLSAIEGSRMFGRAPRFSGPQQPIYLHSQGGVATLETRYSKVEFKQRERIERELQTIGQELRDCQKSMGSASELARLRAEFRAKQHELRDFMRQAKPSSAMFKREWAMTKKQATQLSRQPFLPADTTAQIGATPNNPKQTGGQLMWTVPPLSYFDLDGKQQSFAGFDQDEVTECQRAAEKLGRLRYAFESSPAMAQSPTMLASQIQHVEEHQQALARFSDYDDPDVVHDKVAAVDRFVDQLDQQLQANAGLLTDVVNDQESRSVRLDDSTCKRIHEINQVPTPSVSPSMRL